jgi:hypothetical protein
MPHTRLHSFLLGTCPKDKRYTSMSARRRTCQGYNPYSSRQMNYRMPRGDQLCSLHIAYSFAGWCSTGSAPLRTRGTSYRRCNGQAHSRCSNQSLRCRSHFALFQHKKGPSSSYSHVRRTGLGTRLLYHHRHRSCFWRLWVGDTRLGIRSSRSKR